MGYNEADTRLPNADLPLIEVGSHRFGDEEVWLSLASPLKHQLSAAAVKCVDNAMEIRSVKL